MSEHVMICCRPAISHFHILPPVSHHCHQASQIHTVVASGFFTSSLVAWAAALAWKEAELTSGMAAEPAD
jgi:hypothetical protein